MNDKIISTADNAPLAVMKVANNKTQTRGSDVAAAVRVNKEALTQTQDKTAENPQALQEKITQLNHQMQSLRRDLQFTVDEQSGEPVIKVIDSETKEVIRQIPSEEMLKIRESIDNLKGVLFKGMV